MNSPADLLQAIRSRLPNDGERFDAAEAALAMEDFYRNDRVDGCEDDSLVVVAGKFGDRPDRRFEIAFFRSFDLVTQVQVSLHFPISLRSWFLPTFIDCCDSVADGNRFFQNIRSARWFRRYATTSAAQCSIRWMDAEETGKIFASVVPGLIKALGPHL